nr:hypothetical protein [Tanacetum cinerariifolium]
MPTLITDEERIRREHAYYISRMEMLFTIIPCPRPIENANTLVETLPSSPIPVQDELNSEEVIAAVMNNIEVLIDDECFNPEGEIDVSTNDEDDDYFPFMFVIRIFLPYLIYPEVFPLLLSAESEDTIFDPGISD